MRSLEITFLAFSTLIVLREWEVVTERRFPVIRQQLKKYYVVWAGGIFKEATNVEVGSDRWNSCEFFTYILR